MRGWLGYRVHVSWHITCACAGLLFGVVGSLLAPLPLFHSLMWIAVGVVLFGVAVYKPMRIVLLCAFLAGVSLGLWRGCGERLALQSYQPYFGKVVRARGTVVEDASIGAHGDMRIKVDTVYVGAVPMHGQLWASLTKNIPVKRGDAVVLTGQMQAGFGTLAASMYRASVSSIERPTPGDIARQMRDWFADAVRKAIPEPEASLGLGYLTGQRSALPASLNEQLQAVGLTHAVVASGYNLTILVALSRRLLAKKSKYLATLAAALLIGGFMMVTGLSPSMSRAGLVSGLSLFAWYYGRTIHPIVLLTVAAAITVWINPSYIWGDIGWYLSFAAFVGVLLVGPLLHGYFWQASSRTHIVRGTVIETLSAELVTAPIILHAFGQYAAYALLANVLVVPLIPLTMLLVFGAGLGVLLIGQTAHWVALPASVILHTMLWITGYVAGLPGALRIIHFGAWQVGLYYGLLAIGLGYLWHKTNHRFGN